MKAKVVPALQGFDPEEKGFMILIKQSEHGRYKSGLLIDGKPYFTHHKEEAEAKALKLNETFKAKS